MIKIYHNPRCRKSREGLALLQNSGKEFKIVPYLDTVPTKAELKLVLMQLGYAPIDLVRTNETVWKQHFKGKELSEDMILEAMVQHPRLIERPIVILNNKAVIGRPPEKILELLK